MPFDLVAFLEGTMEHRYPDVDFWLDTEESQGPGSVIGLTGTWKYLKRPEVGLVLHVFDGSLAVAYVDGALRAFVCEGSKLRVLRVGSSERELL